MSSAVNSVVSFVVGSLVSSLVGSLGDYLVSHLVSSHVSSPVSALVGSLVSSLVGSLVRPSPPTTSYHACVAIWILYILHGPGVRFSTDGRCAGGLFHRSHKARNASWIAGVKRYTCFVCKVLFVSYIS